MQKQPKDNPSTIRLGAQLDADVNRMCEELEIRRSAFIRKAVKHYVERQDHIDSVLRAARESYAKYKATGMGVPWDEASVWLQSWGSEDQEPPISRDMRR